MYAVSKAMRGTNMHRYDNIPICTYHIFLTPLKLMTTSTIPPSGSLTNYTTKHALVKNTILQKSKSNSETRFDTLLSPTRIENGKEKNMGLVPFPTLSKTDLKN